MQNSFAKRVNFVQFRKKVLEETLIYLNNKNTTNVKYESQIYSENNEEFANSVIKTVN